MKSVHPICKSLSVNILPAVLAILFIILCVGHAYSASEPGTVTIVVNVEPTNLDPTDCMSTLTGQVLLKNVAEALTAINPDDSSLSPRLATSWKQVDANTWHFFLRKGVKFHDGEDFNANAVIFNIKRLYDKRTVTMTRSKFSGVKMEGKALDSHTLEIKTDKLEPLLPILIGMLGICSPNTPLDKLTRVPIGTGPYKFVKWDAGTQIVLERFNGYWGKQPAVKKAVYTWRKESSVRAAMVLIGEADFTPNIAVQDATRPDMDHSYLDSETTQMRFGGEWEPPLNDRRYRMALNLAVDRNAIRGTILSKDVIPATQIIVPSTFGYNPDLKPWPYDPKKARQLLDEARKDGVPVDKEVLLVGRIAQWPGSDEMMEAMLTMYTAVGFNVKLKIGERLAIEFYRRRPYLANAGPFILVRQHNNPYGDAAFTAYGNYHCKGDGSSLCDKKTDELIEKAEVATGEERRTLWKALFKRLHEEIIPDVVLFHMVAYARVGNRISFRPSIATNGEIPLEQMSFK